MQTKQYFVINGYHEPSGESFMEHKTKIMYDSREDAEHVIREHLTNWLWEDWVFEVVEVL